MFGSVTWRPVRSVTLTAMGERGHDKTAVVRSFGDAEQVLAWYDNRQALGVNAVTFAPVGTTAVTAAMQAVGVASRDGAVGGANHRVTYLENDGMFFDAIGTFLYEQLQQRRGAGAGWHARRYVAVLRIYDPQFYPLNGNAVGPGMYRDQYLHNYTVTADWQPTRT